MTVPVIDRARLAAICNGDAALEAELLQMLVDEALPLIDAIGTAQRDGDAVAGRESAHALKGIAGNVGAVQLEAVARGLEDAFARADGAAIAAGASAIVTAFRAFRSAVSEPAA